MPDSTIIDAMVPTDGTLGNAFERILQLKRNGVYETILGDANNFNPVPTPVTQTRENYGNKGLPAVEKIGDSWVVSFNVEVVRNPTTKAVAAAMQWYVELLNIANSNGAGNKADFRWFDAYDSAIPAHEGTFSVTAVDQFNAYNEKLGSTFTLTSDGVVADIVSPIAGTGVPLIESVLTPAGKTVGDVIVIRGYKFGGTVSLTIDGQATPKFQVIDDRTLTAIIPTGVTGAAPIIVTNAAGASASFSYAAA